MYFNLEKGPRSTESPASITRKDIIHRSGLFVNIIVMDFLFIIFPYLVHFPEPCKKLLTLREFIVIFN